MSLMWIRLRPCVSLPIKHPPEIPQNFAPCARQLIIPSRPSVYRFGEQDEVESAGQTALGWSPSAGLSFDVRRAGCLIARPRTDESVCLYFISACHCHVNLSSVIAPSAGQTQAGDSIVPPFCRIPTSCSSIHLGEEECFSFPVLAQGQMATTVSYCKICFTMPVFLLMWNIPRGHFIPVLFCFFFFHCRWNGHSALNLN